MADFQFRPTFIFFLGYKEAYFKLVNEVFQFVFYQIVDSCVIIAYSSHMFKFSFCIENILLDNQFSCKIVAPCDFLVLGVSIFISNLAQSVITFYSTPVQCCYILYDLFVLGNYIIDFVLNSCLSLLHERFFLCNSWKKVFTSTSYSFLASLQIGFLCSNPLCFWRRLFQCSFVILFVILNFLQLL